MSHQEDGWPLGLQPLNMRIGLIRNRDFSGSISFNTIITGSSSSSDFSSDDLDTESTGSFFHDKSITLGNLIGVSNVVEGRRRLASFRTRSRNPIPKKNPKPRSWFSLCAKAQIDDEDGGNPPSLAHFLEVERRAARFQNGDRNVFGFVLDGFPASHGIFQENSLFDNGRVTAPRRVNDSRFDSDGSEGSTRAATHSDGCVAPTLFSCACGLLNH